VLFVLEVEALVLLVLHQAKPMAVAVEVVVFLI
jgi:hypothetical protein